MSNQVKRKLVYKPRMTKKIRIKSLSIVCPKCDAAPGKQCRDSRPLYMRPGTKRTRLLSKPHRERLWSVAPRVIMINKFKPGDLVWFDILDEEVVYDEYDDPCVGYHRVLGVLIGLHSGVHHSGKSYSVWHALVGSKTIRGLSISDIEMCRPRRDWRRNRDSLVGLSKSSISFPRLPTMNGEQFQWAKAND